MVKFVKTFENEIVENKLVFRGKEFTITMTPDESGSRSKEKGMDCQLQEAFPDDTEIKEIAEIADQLWYVDEMDIQELMEQLTELE